MPAVRRSKLRTRDDDEYIPVEDDQLEPDKRRTGGPVGSFKRESKSSSFRALTPKLVVVDAEVLVNALTASNDGFPNLEQYATAVEAVYYASLTPRKRAKALIDAATYEKIQTLLFKPDCMEGTPQFRFWVRKMFKLGTGPLGQPVVCYNGRAVAIKEQIYGVLVDCHRRANHGGRDRTNAIIREHFAWVPKELVALFLKVCPTCNLKRSSDAELRGYGHEHAHAAAERSEREKRDSAPQSSRSPSPMCAADSPPFAWGVDSVAVQSEAVDFAWVEHSFRDTGVLPKSGQEAELLTASFPFFARRPTTGSSISSDSSAESGFSSRCSSFSTLPPFDPNVPLLPPLQRPTSAPVRVGMLDPFLPLMPPLSAPAMASNNGGDYFALASTRSDPARFAWQEGLRSAFDAPLGAFDLAAPFPSELITGMKALELFKADSDPTPVGAEDASADIPIDPVLLKMDAEARNRSSTARASRSNTPVEFGERVSPPFADEQQRRCT
ncbi:hypothetical protein AURDEDRAFT_183962 [Auricularia subglabra TFB-10046 SS5]|nr:hypothetical protein AURDEDRAFT_183962 [Auricularia subglabra TFB-10046 SS5]